MSAGSGSNKFEFSKWGPVAGGVGGTFVGGNQVRRQLVQEKSAKLQRDLERVKDLNAGIITPPQSAFYCARDEIPRSHIETNLTLWGGTHDGHNYSIPNSFSLEPIEITSPRWYKRVLRQKERNYRLNLYPPNKGQGKKGLLRRRGGYTPPADPLIKLEDGQEMTVQECLYYNNMSDNMSSKKSQWSPNPFYEISEQNPRESEEYLQDGEYLQDSEGRLVARSYLLPLPDESPDFWVSPGVVVLVVAGYFMFNFRSNYVQRKFANWIASEESQRPISLLQRVGLFKGLKKPQGEGQELEAGKSSQEPVSAPQEPVSVRIETVSVEEFKKLQGEKRELEAEKKQQTTVRPEFLLELFISYKQEIITKGAATRILMTYYHLSEAEALKWLNEK